MKYVVDSSVVLKWVLPEVDSAKAIRLRDEYKAGIHDLIAPDVFTPEVGNGLVSAERQNRIGAGEAIVFFATILRAAPMIHSSPPYVIRAMEIAISKKQAIYDCLYLALAEAEGCEMVSADDAFVRKLRADFPFLIRLADLP